MLFRWKWRPESPLIHFINSVGILIWPLRVDSIWIQMSVCKWLTEWRCIGCARPLRNISPIKKGLALMFAMQSKKPRRQRKTTKKTRNKKNKYKKRSSGKKGNNQRGKQKCLMQRVSIRNTLNCFFMEIPKVAPNGRAEFDRQGQPKFRKEYSQYSFYLIVHHGCWKEHNYTA